ncbi:hypothetical protein TKK_0005196 [Trichogramma kaykai]
MASVIGNSYTPILIMNSILGIGPLQYPVGKAYRLPSFIYTMLLVITFLYLFYDSTSFYAHLFEDKPYQVVDLIIWISPNLISVALILSSAWKNSKRWVKCILNIEKANIVIKGMPPVKDFSVKFRMSILKLIIFMVPVPCILLFISFFNTYEIYGALHDSSIFIVAYSTLTLWCGIFSLVYMLNHIRYKFYHLNASLENLSDEISNQSRQEMRADELKYYTEESSPIRYLKCTQKDYSHYIKSAKYR